MERANFTALNIEESLYFGNSKYILYVLKTYGTVLGYFMNSNFLKNTVAEDSEKLRSFFVGKNSSTYQGALNYCTPETFFKDVYVFDFTSMYPSILLNQNLDYATCIILTIDEYLALSESILSQCVAVPYRNHSDDEFLKQNKFPFDVYQHPKIDYENDTAVMLWYKNEKGFLPQIVEHFLEKRLEAKSLYKKTKNIIHYNKQLNIKIFLNSIYGCMASTDTDIACLYMAMIITAFARIYLLACYEYFTSRNFIVAYCDTDSIFVVTYETPDPTQINRYLNQPYMILAYEQTMSHLLVISKKRYIFEVNGKLKTKGFEKKGNELVKWMSKHIITCTLEALKKGEKKDRSEGFIILVNILVLAYMKCRDPKKFCITRKTKNIEDYKSKTCPQMKILLQHPELAGQFIDFTYSQADVSLKEQSKWIMDVEHCTSVDFEKLFTSNEGDKKYAILENGKQIYAKKINNEFYLSNHKNETYAKDENDNEYYAKADGTAILPTKVNGEFNYAKTKLNKEIYPKDKDQNEFYISNKNKNKLAIDENLNTFYAKNKDKNEILPKDNNIEYYLTTKENIEIYPVNNEGKPYYRKIKSKEIYAKNKGNEYIKVVNNSFTYATDNNIYYYPVDKSLNPYYQTIGNKQIYAIDSDEKEHYLYSEKKKMQIYAKNNGDEYPAKHKTNPYYAWRYNEKNEKVEYPPKKADNTEIYLYRQPKNITTGKDVFSFNYNKVQGKEVYFGTPDKQQFFILDNSNIPKYAVDENGDEYFPKQANSDYYIKYEETQYYPKLKSKKQFYLQKGKKEIYAKKKKDEYYALDENLNSILALNDNNPYYAKMSDTKEIYPKLNNNEFYRIENQKEICAKTKENKFYYAQDKTLNEFYPKILN
ncbi:DNA polymerase [Trichonephila clavipes]|nr:DNA polymerase [Trichonephila clavipes]